MKHFNDLPYRLKLLISHLSIVLLIVLIITSLVTYTASSRCWKAAQPTSTSSPSRC